MDFLSTLSDSYDKLKNKNIVNILWKEILKEERLEENLDLLIEYSFHYAVDSDFYLEELNEKFDELDKNDLAKIDGHLKAYLITFLYYCTNRFNHEVPLKTKFLASTLYIKLLSIPNIGKIFFEKNMFKVQLVLILEAVKETLITESQILFMLKLLKKYCIKEKLEIFLQKAVVNIFIGIMMITAKKDVQNIKNMSPIPLFCINSIRDILLHEENDNRIKNMMEGLFRSLGKNIVRTIENTDSARSVTLILIRDVLQEELDEDKFRLILEAFCISWGKGDFNYYEDAVAIMNVLKYNYYKELVGRMVLYTQSKNYKRFLVNIMHLLLAIAKNLPTFKLDKIEVLYSCALRNIFYYFLDKDTKLVDNSIETIANICQLKDNALVDQIFNHVSNGKFINVRIETILLCINKIASEKCGSVSRNKNLLIIAARFLSNSKQVNSDLVQKTLNTICKDASPFALKSSLPILHKLYIVLVIKNDEESAQAILKIMFQNAMHEDSSSMEFAEHIFYSLLKPSVIDNVTYDPKYYYNVFLSSDFDYELLFSKCQRLIQPKQVDNVIKHFDYDQPGAAVLICCLLNYCNYEKSTDLATYFINHFYEIAIRSTMGPLSIAFRKIIVNKTITQNDTPQLDLLHSCLLEGLFEQTYQVPCIKPAFDLMQKIRNILKIGTQDEVLSQLLDVTSERAFRRLHRREIGDLSVFMYLNEMCILIKRNPSENVVKLLNMYMNNPTKFQELKEFMPDIYLQLLTLFTTLAMINRKQVPMAIHHVKTAMLDESQITKILGFKLYYSLCQEITHEFDDIEKFAFEEIVVADPCLLRLLIIAIEELVHDDFIKLDATHFFKFIYVLGYNQLTIFMKNLLSKRFMLSNQNDIAKFYVRTIMYMHTYYKMPKYPISTEFKVDLSKMKPKINCAREIPTFLFGHLPIKKKFNVLTEISSILDYIVGGHCKVDVNFFPMLKDLIFTFKLINKTRAESKSDKHYYTNICKEVEKKIVKFDTSYKEQSFYDEYEPQIRKCTLSLLNLLFLENQQVADNIQMVLFDALMHWIDFVLHEIIAYVHVEKGKEYGQYFSKLIQYFKQNKTKFVSMDR